MPRCRRCTHPVESDEDDTEDDAQEVAREAAVKRVEHFELLLTIGLTKTGPVRRQQYGNSMDGKKAEPPQHLWAIVVSYCLDLLPCTHQAAHAFPEPTLAHHTTLTTLGSVSHVRTSRLELKSQPRKRIVYEVV